jgi:uncharacterized membrane protein
MKRMSVLVLLVLAFGGIADSFYIAQNETQGTPLFCGTTLSGCNIVTASPYAYIFGIPLAEYGVMFYSIMFMLAALELVMMKRLVRRFLQWGALFGAVGSLYFVCVQVFFIGALGSYCLTSAGIAFLMLLFSTLLEPIRTPDTLSISETTRTETSLSMPPRV